MQADQAMTPRETDIIMSGPMCLALLRECERPGTGKTQTRRLAYREVKHDSGHYKGVATERKPSKWLRMHERFQEAKAKGIEGYTEIVWVRETCGTGGYFPHPWAYRADGKEYPQEKWRPAIHMPRRASRLTLTVSGTKLERVQEITEEDAMAEGARRFDDIPAIQHGPYHAPDRWSMEDPPNTDHCLGTAYFAFANYWRKLHGPESWAANPWCIAVSFKPIAQNIDSIREAA